jgi:hypothetical protein
MKSTHDLGDVEDDPSHVLFVGNKSISVGVQLIEDSTEYVFGPVHEILEEMIGISED